MSGQQYLSHAGALLVTLLTGTALVAQSDNGTITGTVTDQASALVPGEEITVLNPATDATCNTGKTETGNYTIPSRPSGNGHIVNRPEFGQLFQMEVSVQVAVCLRIEIALQAGATAESVTVTAHAPLLRTEGAEQNFNIIGDQINARPVAQAINTSTGVRRRLNQGGLL